MISVWVVRLESTLAEESLSMWLRTMQISTGHGSDLSGQRRGGGEGDEGEGNGPDYHDEQQIYIIE